MEIDVQVTKKMNIKRFRVEMKVTDRFGGIFIDSDGNKVKTIEDQSVPDFFPGQHHGDYLFLDIDLETGRIQNWQKPTPEELTRLYNGPQDDE